MLYAAVYLLETVAVRILFYYSVSCSPQEISMLYATPPLIYRKLWQSGYCFSTLSLAVHRRLACCMPPFIYWKLWQSGYCFSTLSMAVRRKLAFCMPLIIYWKLWQSGY